MTRFETAAALALAMGGSGLWAQAPGPAATPNSGIASILSAGKLDDLRYPDLTDCRVQLQELYNSRQFEPLFYHDGTLTAQAWELMDVLRDAGVKGLRPEDYDGGHWAKRLADRMLGTSRDDPDRIDVGLTVSVLRYMKDVSSGRANPGDLTPSGSRPFDYTSYLRDQVIAVEDPAAALAQLEPADDEYRLLLSSLQQYHAMAAAYPPEAKLTETGLANPGDSYPQLDALAEHLMARGDLRSDESPASGNTTYSGNVVNAVKRFQEQHDLRADGVIGPATLKQMNVSLPERERQLQLALERKRWVPHTSAQPPVIVNVPAFELRAYGPDGKVALRMKVVVGAAYQHRTPMIASQISTIVFHPFWNVPYDIQRNELVPKLASESDYLARNHYEIVDADVKHVDAAVTPDLLNKLRIGALLVRQVPGPDNSLGPLKFDFPNPHAVYMHGTPDTELFDRTRRDLSHGCIRLEDPVALATWLLRDDPAWDRDKVSAGVKATATRKVFLKVTTPVLIVYNTAEIGDDGDLHFYDDIYGRDADLIAALDRMSHPMTTTAGAKELIRTQPH